MKTKAITFLFILGLGLLMSCNNDDDYSQKETIDGIWNLKNVNLDSRLNIDYEIGEVVWNFDLNTNTLIIENNSKKSGSENIRPEFESGTYNFEIQQNFDTQSLMIKGIDMGPIILSPNNFTIGAKIIDGLKFEFSR